MAAGPVQVQIDPAPAHLAHQHDGRSRRRAARRRSAPPIKPDLGAPGAWTSAVAGTGTDRAPVQRHVGRHAGRGRRRRHPAPGLPRARTPPPSSGGLVEQRRHRHPDGRHRGQRSRPTPVTRIGGGEVRPYAALQSDTQVGDPDQRRRQPVARRAGGDGQEVRDEEAHDRQLVRPRRRPTSRALASANAGRRRQQRHHRHGARRRSSWPPAAR